MNVVRRRRRAMFVGCSHGGHISPAAADAVIKFAADFKPHHRVHLGDAFDTTAFRTGAAGTADDAADVDEDFSAGEAFLRRYRPTVLFMGNHEDRLWKLAESPSALVAKAARDTIKQLEALCEDIGAQMVPYAGTAAPESWVLFGDTLAGHGFMFNEMCTRDHVEMLGRGVIHAHNHRAGMATGRVVGAPMGYSVGTLATIGAMAYAKARRATAAWSGAIVAGEYGDGWSKWTLHMLHSAPAVRFAAPVADGAAA